jgi:hypothetical protein
VAISPLEITIEAGEEFESDFKGIGKVDNCLI